MTTTNHYFNTALRSLQDALRGYAKLHPNETHLLNLSDVHHQDPTIERLLEGFAYISGEINRIIDDDLPEISETLLRQLAPTLLDPIPSKTVIQFSPNSHLLQKPMTIPKGSQITSDWVGGNDSKVICHFTTERDCTIYPLTITHVTSNIDSSGFYTINMTIQTNTIETFKLNQLTFYLHGDYRTVCQLYEFLIHQVDSIDIHCDQPHHSMIQEKNTLTFQSPFFSKDTFNQTILDKTKQFFACPEQLFFVTLTGLEKINFPKNCKQFEICIKSHQTLVEEMHLDTETFKVNCVSATNLYQSTTEPIILNNKSYEYPLYVNLNHTEGIQLHSIEKIEGIQHLNGKKHEYFPLYQSIEQTKSTHHYQLIKRYDKFGKQQIYLQFNMQPNSDTETISCLVNVTNGHYPKQYLFEGSIHIGDDHIPNMIACKNITQPSQYLTPPSQKNLLWYLISHLSLNLRSLCQIDDLKQFLKNCEWSFKLENLAKIESILSIETQMKQHIHHGLQYPLLELNLTLDEKNFLSSSEVYLFGDLLQTIFSESIQINFLFNQTVICKPSFKTFIWSPIMGKKKCL